MQIQPKMIQMLNRLKPYLSQHKLLLVALIISLLVHALLLSKFSLSLPELDETHQTLEMRLVNLQPTNNSTKSENKITPVENDTKPEPEAQDTENETQPSPLPEPAKDTNPLAEPSAAENNLSDSTSTVSTQKTIAPDTESPAVETTATNDSGEIATEPKPQAYHYVETEFEIRRDNDLASAGTATVIFKLSRESTYTITSTTEAKGLASLIFSTLKQTSEGVVTERGLQPNYYEYRYGDDEKKLQIANFAWSDAVVEMKSAKGTKAEKLLEGTQDLLSFMYQFMFSPPLSNMQITMTNGKNLRTYTYSFEGEAQVQTKLGELKTVHLAKTGEDEEKTEIWLAVDYQYLPVKIRKTEKNGNVIEQVAIKLTTKLD